MSADKIARMANQIAMFMETKPEAEGIAGLANHINDFWEPRMRRQFFEIVDAGGAGLDGTAVGEGDLRRAVAQVVGVGDDEAVGDHDAAPSAAVASDAHDRRRHRVGHPANGGLLILSTHVNS